MRICPNGKCLMGWETDSTSFCGLCGRELVAAPKCLCGKEYDPRLSFRKFCGECGKPLAMASEPQDTVISGQNGV